MTIFSRKIFKTWHRQIMVHTDFDGLEMRFRVHRGKNGGIDLSSNTF